MKKGFTLSEVLITLGVVGIVAVLTIPNVMKNYQNRLYTAQLEKVYAQIADAVQSHMNDEHVDNFYETTAGRYPNLCDMISGECPQGIGYFLTNYFKTVRKNCIGPDTDACITTKTGTYKTLDGTNVTPDGDYFVQTITGATIGGKLDATIIPKRVRLIVDVNGMAQPNIIGRDIFSMEIQENGTLTDVNKAKGSACTQGTGNMYLAAQGCLSKIIEDGWKMTY
jgi:prepilin-type N-terminal cleavage/methylation domain-containing protein